MKEHRTGCVHLYCGDGKGKTTAALGAALRASGRGMSVLILRFLKTDDSGEIPALANVPGIEVIPCARTFGFSWNMTEEEKREAAVYYRNCLEEGWKRALGSESESGCDLLILDEAVGACRQGFLDEERLAELICGRPSSMEVILTGRNPSPRLMEVADYITEMKQIRHPYEKGIPAREGIEF